MKITNEILKENKMIKGSKNSIHIPAFIASVFSVLFSLSIVLELNNLVNPIIVAFMTIFTILFLVINERFKVNGIRAIYNGKKRAVWGFVATFIVSVAMSSIGIYLWTNKTFEIEQQISTNVNDQIHTIESEYLNKISDVQAQTFETTGTNVALNETLNYWRKKGSATLDERNIIREHIRETESKIETARLDFNTKNLLAVNSLTEQMNSSIDHVKTSQNISLNNLGRSNKISYIFLAMILITEIGILVLNKQVVMFSKTITTTPLAKGYMVARSLLQSLYLAQVKGIVNMHHALYSPTMNKLDWDDNKKWNETKKLYNLFINLGILSEGVLIDVKGGGKVLKNALTLPENDAFKKFDEYYEKLMTI